MSDEWDSDAVATAYLKHRAMEQQAEYLSRGRRFQSVEDDKLDAEWAATFEATLIREEQARRVDFNDLGAEIKLRDREEPAHLVAHVMPALKARINALFEEDDLGALKERLEDFIVDWKGDHP